MVNFDLFIQTGYSFNGSMIDIEKLVQRAKNLGFASLGIADRKNLHGAVKFYQACSRVGIKPLIGIQFYLDSDRFAEQPVLVYAKSNSGYKNLIRLSSRLACEKQNPNLEELSEFDNDVAFVCLATSGPVYQALMDGDVAKAMEFYRVVTKALHETYIGFDLNEFSVEMKIAPHLEEIGKTVIVNQVNYFDKEDRAASKILSQILNEQNQMGEGLFLNEDNFYELKSPDQLDRIYSSFKSALKNTQELIDSCNLEMDFSKINLPKYPIAEGYSAQDYLKALSRKGLEIRLRNKKGGPFDRKKYQDRLEEELSIINRMGYDDYFLIVWDFVLFAKKRKILVGPGRGSAAGSLVAYVLGIVDIDPLDFDLYFERFLNPERITMPDIDMDFPDDHRDEVIQYVADKYGRDHVTSIVAFGTFQGKSALRDTARVLHISETIVSEVTSYVGETDNSIQQFIETHEKQYQNLMENKEIAYLFEIASKFVDLPRHTSTHAAGIIITDEPITTYAPIQPGINNLFQTQFEATDLELIGLLKIDFLGLRNLTTIQNILDLIHSDTGDEPDVYKIPLDDKNTFDLFKRVDTLGIFQLESSGMMNLLREMQLDKFEDISTCIALYRPGPMESIPAYLKRRKHQEKVSFLHEDLKPILESTEGIIIYQEQIMKIANVFAGYSLGEADVLRRAVSKKKESVLQEERSKFIASCLKNHRDEALSNEIYDLIVKFANYGFNKSHSVVYSLVAYWMAYLKANYPTHFMAVLMDSAIGSQRATNDYIKECRKLGIRVLPPEVNESRKHYVRNGENLRYPTLGIKNIGSVVADRLDALTNEGPFRDFMDFMKRATDINSRVVESMIMVGMFDSFGLTKRTMIENLKQISTYLSIPHLANEEDFVFIPYEEYDFDTLQKAEKDLIGLNLRFHPVNRYQAVLEREHLDTVTDVLMENARDVKFVGVLQRVKVITTKKGDEMAFLALEDQLSQLECVLFSTEYSKYRNSLEKDELYLIQGKQETRNHRTQIVISSIRKWKGEIK